MYQGLQTWIIEEGEFEGSCENGMEAGSLEVSEDESLPGRICWIFEEESRRETMLRVYAYEDEEAGGVDLVVEKECVEIEALLYGENGGLE